MAVKFGFFVLSVLFSLGLTSDSYDWDYIFEIPDKAPFKPLTNKHDFFDWQLFQNIALEKKNENIVVSPFSVKILLNILKEASASISLQELAHALVDIPAGKEGHKLYQDILKSLEEKSDDYQLDIGTKLYVDNSITPQPEFLEIVRSIYHTSIDNVHFIKLEETAKKINDWCSDVTRGSIKELVKADKLEGLVAVLANAIYFKGSWVLPFDERDSLNKKFTLRTGEDIPISAMVQLSNFYFLETKELGEGVKLLRMAYKGSKYAMTFILPNKADGLDKVLESITPGKIEKLQKQMKLVPVAINMPKFEFATKSELKPILQKLNIRDIFNPTAKLPGLGKNILVNDIIQKAGVKVDETGTEIYAATDIDLTNRDGSFESFRALHPFAFFLEDETTGALLFAGKVVDPTKN